ncbi:MAG: tyrosine-type recombinase/integrase [Fibrobacter sp.]|nr:tyrosine-type recombinase/integrase [Fibrobacter sp.]
MKKYATISDYRPRINHVDNYIRPVVGDMRISQVSEADWESVLRRAHNKGLSHKYISNIRSTIIHFCKYAKKNKHLSSIPDIDPRIYRSAPRGTRRILSPDDIRILFSSEHEMMLVAGEEVPCENILLFRAYVLSGFRPGEGLGLRKKDINFDDKTITLERSVNFYGEITKGKTDNARRTICMAPQLESVIRSQLHRTEEIKSEYVFPDTSTERIGMPQLQKRVHYDWKRWTAYNLNNYCSLYELRHTLFSYAKNHLSEERLKEYFGHTESMNSSEVYGHAVFIELRRTAELLSNVFSSLIPCDD